VLAAHYVCEITSFDLLASGVPQKASCPPASAGDGREGANSAEALQQSGETVDDMRTTVTIETLYAPRIDPRTMVTRGRVVA
jgi:hypothetical protein